jgi:PST family polysaccharide transporter
VNPPLKEGARPSDEASAPGIFQLLRSVLTLGASSVLSIMIAIVLAKTWSTLLGPSKYGLAALMQSMLSLGGTVAGVGAGQALSREGAHAIGQNDQRRVNALRVAALQLVVASSGLCAVLLILFRSPIARLVLGSSSHSDAVLLLAPALVALTASGVLSSVLVAYRRIAAIAKFNVASTGIYAIVGIPLVAVWRGSGIAPSLLIAAVLSCLLVLIVVHRQAGRVTRRVPLHEILRETGRLLRFGMGYTFAACVGGGVLMVMPVLVLHLLNPASVGFYDAAVAISVNYVGLSTAALGQEYFPRLASMRDDGARVVRAINDQIRLMRLVAAPLLFLALALAPLGVPILYSGAFRPAVTVLTWMIVADALRVPSWTMAWAVLAVRGSGLYMLLETCGGLSLLGAVVLGIRVFGLSGVGIGFLVGYGLYYGAIWLICRKALSLRLSRTNSVWTSLTIVGALAVQVVSLRAPHFRTLVAVPVALIAVGLSARVFWMEHRQPTVRPAD